MRGAALRTTVCSDCRRWFGGGFCGSFCSRPPRSPFPVRVVVSVLILFVSVLFSFRSVGLCFISVRLVCAYSYFAWFCSDSQRLCLYPFCLCFCSVPILFMFMFVPTSFFLCICSPFFALVPQFVRWLTALRRRRYCGLFVVFFFASLCGSSSLLLLIGAGGGVVGEVMVLLCRRLGLFASVVGFLQWWPTPWSGRGGCGFRWPWWFGGFCFGSSGGFCCGEGVEVMWYRLSLSWLWWFCSVVLERVRRVDTPC
jgi:hypothetical protein